MTGLITIVRNDDRPPTIERIPRVDVRKIRISGHHPRRTLAVIAFGVMQPFELPWDALGDDVQRAQLYEDVARVLEIDVTWTLTMEERTRWGVEEIDPMTAAGWKFPMGPFGGEDHAYRWLWVRTEQRPS